MNASSGRLMTSAAAAVVMAWSMAMASAASVATPSPAARPGAAPSTATALAVQPDSTAQRLNGAYLYKTYCASCHGVGATGDGPLASSLRRRPPNLTEIAKRNMGVFPSAMVEQIIDGRQPVRGHGGPDMPVWGDAFLRTTEGGTEEGVKAKIGALVAYLESIQLRDGW